jgi:hypothetical protein
MPYLWLSIFSNASTANQMLPTAMMKHCAGLLCAVVCLSASSCSTKTIPEETSPEAVIVRVLETPLPTDEEAITEFLWNTFANKPDEEKYGSFVLRGWKANYEAFADALVRKAADQNLDSASLRRILDLILRESEGETAFLPVGAYQARLNGESVWIVITKWEIAFEDDEDADTTLGHISAFVYEQKTLKLVGFMTCG